MPRRQGNDHSATGADARLVEKADRLAEPVSGYIAQSSELVEECLRRQRTFEEVFSQGEWLTAEDINRLQRRPLLNKGRPAADWRRRGRLFSVNFRGEEYFAGYQFDALCQPLPVIKEILAAYGPVADSWALAAWFHFPSPWLVERDECAARNLAPKDALGRPHDVVVAASKRMSSFAA